MSMSGASARSLEMNRSNRTSIRSGIDRRDAQAIADGRIGRRAASLAEDARIAGKADQVPDGQEIGRVIQLLDDGELALDQLGDLGGDAGGISLVAPAQASRAR